MHSLPHLTFGALEKPFCLSPKAKRPAWIGAKAVAKDSHEAAATTATKLVFNDIIEGFEIGILCFCDQSLFSLFDGLDPEIHFGD